MINNTREGEKKAKMRFAALYVLGLLLIFVVVSAFWQKNESAVDPVEGFAEREIFFMQFDTLLHNRLENLDGLYSGYVKSRQNGSDDYTTSFLTAKSAFALTLDSIDQQASFLSNGTKKQVMTEVAAKFRKVYTARYNLITELAGLPKQTFAASDSNNIEANALIKELDELKKMLVDKEQKIIELQGLAQANTSGSKDVASLNAQRLKELTEKDKVILDLQNQIKQKEAALQKAMSVNNSSSKPVINNTTGDSEWKQKYSSLKAAYDKVTASEKSLKSAYKTVADDNRRLLGQLQSMRKG